VVAIKNQIIRGKVICSVGCASACNWLTSPFACLSHNKYVKNQSAKSDRNYTAMRIHVPWSVHLSALLITWFTWGDGLQRRYTSDVAFCIICFPLTIDNSDMN
jgi:hypothetical protein